LIDAVDEASKSIFRIVSDDPGCQPRWPPLLKIENSAKNHLKFFSSETARPIGPTLVEWSLGDPLSEFCATTPAASQDVRHY
jgi:hypothetical protein